MISLLPLLDLAQNECAALGVRLVLTAEEQTRAGDFGYFDDKRKILLVCAENRDWPYVLAHELGHMDDWRRYPGDWVEDRDEYELFDAWLIGERKFSPRQILHLTRKIQRCEHYAEKYALRLLRRISYPNITRLVHKANFGLWQYEAARRAQRWVEMTPAGEAAMPDRLISLDALGRLPVGFGG